MCSTLAWGDLCCYEVPRYGHVWGREFQLLPKGSMFHSAGVLHGLIGLPARRIGKTKCEVDIKSPLQVYGVRGTDPKKLEEYYDELAERFSARQMAQDV